MLTHQNSLYKAIAMPSLHFMQIFINKDVFIAQNLFIPHCQLRSCEVTKSSCLIFFFFFNSRSLKDEQGKWNCKHLNARDTPNLFPQWMASPNYLRHWQFKQIGDPAHFNIVEASKVAANSLRLLPRWQALCWVLHKNGLISSSQHSHEVGTIISIIS